MTNKTILEEIRGTIIKVYEYPVSNGETITSIEEGIVILPDDSSKGMISEAIKGRDYSQFSVGQRVVNVTYTWKRPATETEKREYANHGEECPNEIDEFEYVTYDELSYYRENQSSKIR